MALTDKLTAIADAIRSKTGESSTLTLPEMAQAIEDIPTGSAVVTEQALNLYDWEGTLLKSYTAEEALALTALPAPADCPMYAAVDHELLLFQEWNWSLANIKSWLTNNPNEKLNVVAIYTTSDSENHNYWANPRGEGSAKISMQKRATTNLANAVFKNYYSLKRLSVPNLVTYVGSGTLNNCYNLQFVGLPNGVERIDDNAFQNDHNLQSICLPNGITAISNQAFQYCSHMESITIPDTVTTIGNSVFKYCFALKNVHLSKSATSIEPLEFNYCYSLNSIWIPSSITQIKDYAFTDCSTLYDVILEGKPTITSTNVFNNTPTTQKIYVPRANLSWFETATNWSTYYSRFVAIEDNIEYLESLGYNVDAYKGGAA